jgi:hypothetical protein
MAGNKSPPVPPAAMMMDGFEGSDLFMEFLSFSRVNHEALDRNP